MEKIGRRKNEGSERASRVVPFLQVTEKRLLSAGRAGGRRVSRGNVLGAIRPWTKREGENQFRRGTRGHLNFRDLTPEESAAGGTGNAGDGSHFRFRLFLPNSKRPDVPSSLWIIVLISGFMRLFATVFVSIRQAIIFPFIFLRVEFRGNNNYSKCSGRRKRRNRNLSLFFQSSAMSVRECGISFGIRISAGRGRCPRR